MDLMQPSFADEQPINPFDFWEGADFKLKIRNVEGYRNYDKSEFSGKSELYDADETKLETVYGQLHDLSEFTDPKNYKSYDELKTKLSKVLGEEMAGGAPTVAQMVQVNEPVAAPVMPSAEQVVAADDDDDTMSYFAKLANDS